MIPAPELSPMGEAALAYARRGWAVFPLHTPSASGCSCGHSSCGNPGKHPRTPRGFKDATRDEPTIITWWTRDPDANIGIATGLASGLIVLDVDPRNHGDHTYAALRSRVNGIPEDVHALTGGGGMHVFLRYPHDTAAFRPKSPGPGIDVKGDGGYVVAPPSLHASGRNYLWEASSHPDDNEVPAIPPTLLAVLGLRLAGPTHAPTTGTAQTTILGRAFALAGLIARPLQDGKIAVICPWQDEHTSGAPGDSSTVIFPAREPNGMGSFHCSHGHCEGRDFRAALDALPPEVVAAAKDAAGYGRPKPSAAAMVSTDQDFNLGAPKAPPSWRGLLIRDRLQNVATIVPNLCAILRYHEAFEGIAWDTFADRLVYRKPIPYSEIYEQARQATHWEDHHAYALADWFAREEGMRFGPEKCADAMRAIAHERPWHPVREYLDGLAWDGEDRVDAWLSTYLGVEDSPYVRDVARTFLIGSVARIYRPGCKLDTILVLEGDQGRGKSTAVKALFSDDWTNDTTIDLHSKDRYQQIAGKWAIEHAELDGLSKADAERVKAFLSSATDRFRPPYGRTEVVVPRQCVFVGSTNSERYLRDETGGRRFLGVRVGAIDLAALRRDRDQIWAEAVAHFHGGDRWWPADALIDSYRAEQEHRRVNDAWEEVLASALIADSEITLREACAKITDEKARWSQADQLRVAKCLRALGWTLGRATTGARARVWRRPVPA